MKSKGIIWLVIVLVAAAGMLAYVKLSPAPNAELKATSLIAPEAIEPSVKETVNAALAAIKSKNAKKLLPLMLETYTEELFKGGDFMPADITGARKNEKSTLGGIVVIVHSQPRGRDYEFNLIQRKGKYLIEGIR